MVGTRVKGISKLFSQLLPNWNMQRRPGDDYWTYTLTEICGDRVLSLQTV